MIAREPCVGISMKRLPALVSSPRLGRKVSETEPAPALGAGEQMQIELVPAWPPAHCSAIKTDGRVFHGGSRPGATRVPVP
jgi:hypothetical protein